MQRNLTKALLSGAQVIEQVLIDGLTENAEAYKMEWQMIWDYHKRHAGQLWNTIDERADSEIHPGMVNSVIH